MEPLRFNENGRFRILHITDFHCGKDFNPKLTAGMEALLKETNPDFVMLGGDQCVERQTPEEAAEYMAKIMAPVLKRSLPWAAVFGNHDRETGLNLEDETDMYNTLPGCMAEKGPEELTGCGNYCLSVLSSKDDSPAFNIFCLDSNHEVDDYYEKFGIDRRSRIILPDHFNEGENGGGPLFDQVSWYYNESLRREKEAGKKIPAVMFMHIPVPEYLQILHNPEETGARGFKRATVGCTEINSGIFLASLQRGDVKGWFFGHEHHCDIEGKYCGVTLAASAALGYNMSAHDDMRGGRVIDLYENGEIHTNMVRLWDIMGPECMRDPDYMEGGIRYFIRKL